MSIRKLFPCILLVLLCLLALVVCLRDPTADHRPQADASHLTQLFPEAEAVHTAAILDADEKWIDLDTDEVLPLLETCAGFGWQAIERTADDLPEIEKTSSYTFRLTWAEQSCMVYYRGTELIFAYDNGTIRAWRMTDPGDSNTYNYPEQDIFDQCYDLLRNNGGRYWHDSKPQIQYPHLSALFPEYTQITGLTAKHDLDRWATADPEQVTVLLNLLELYASFGCEEIHFTEFSTRAQAGDCHFHFDLGAQSCDLYTSSRGAEDHLLFDFGNGDLRTYKLHGLTPGYKAWASQDEKNYFSYQFRTLRNAICDGVDNSIQLNEPRGSDTYINPTKIAGEFARQGIRRAIAENNLYAGAEAPNYNLEIILDGKVYICDDELNVFHIKHKEDTVYKVRLPDCLNYDKTRPDWPAGRIVDQHQQ